MAKLKEPRPGMGQDEKDRLGAALREQAEADALRQVRAAEMARWVPDVNLGGLDKDALLAEAELRRVEVKGSWSKERIVQALRDARREAERAADADRPQGQAADHLAAAELEVRDETEPGPDAGAQAATATGEES